MVTGGLCGARPPSRSVVRVAPARRCGFVGAGPAAAALTVSPFLLWVGAPPRPWGGGGPRLWLPSWGGCGGGGGGGTPLALGPVWEGGGGGVGGVLRFPGDAPCRPKKGGGGRAAWRSQPRGPAIGQGGRALPPPPSTECRILSRSLPGAPHLPAVAARRWPAGGGREGQRSVVIGLRGRFPWVGNKAGVPWRRAVHGGRGHPYHSGSPPPGFSGHDLRGVPVRRRGPTCSSRPPLEPAAGASGRVTLRLPSRAGGSVPSASGGGGRGPCGRRAGGGAGGGGGVAPRPPCSRSRRRPVVLLPGSLRVAGALPSGARLRSGLKCRPVVGGVRGGPWTAPLGASSDLTPSLRHLGAGRGYGRVMWGAASFLLRRARWGGAGAAWRPWSRGPAIGQGVAPVIRPPYRELDARAGPRRGPHLPGRCRAAPAGRGWRMVSGQWLAGCGAAGSSPRLAPPHPLPRVAARPRTSCRTVGGAWVRGPIPPSRARRLGRHLRRRLCGGWGCGGGGLCRR